MARILVVDDEAAQRAIIASICRAEGHQVAEAGGSAAALALLDDFRPDVVLTDLKMKEQGGLHLLEQIRKREDPPETVVMTAYGSVETAVTAMKLGAYDYLTKPLERDELLLVAARAAEKFELRTESRRLKRRLAEAAAGGLVASSVAMRDVLRLAEKVAASDATVLIRGESGSGKERIANLIHHTSARAGKPLVSINCAAFPETLLESELFGYEKGAFTGAQARKHGVIESAEGGTLFLDEVADMSLRTQATMLRVLQHKQIRRVGGVASILVDVRFIAATNRDLEQAVRTGAFREDLYYRLNVIPLVIPPLRGRTDDIAVLVDLFIRRSGRVRRIAPDALAALESYRWPGNVRELEAVMERMLVLTSSEEITLADLPAEVARPEAPVPSPAASAFQLSEAGIPFEQLEREILQQALDKSGGNMAEAAKLLGMTYRTFQYRAQKFKLKGN